MNEWFGPIAFVIATDSTADSLAIARDAVVGHGALTMAVYSTRDDVIERAIEVAEDVGVALSINLTGGVFVNQSARSPIPRHRANPPRTRRSRTPRTSRIASASCSIGCTVRCAIRDGIDRRWARIGSSEPQGSAGADR
jgi:hypothetical protein